MKAKNFRRVYLTLDEEVMTAFGLPIDTVTSSQLRRRLREIAAQVQSGKSIIKQSLRQVQIEEIGCDET